MTLTITLPWPDYDLGGNGRKHWRALSELKRGAKADGYGLAYEALGGRMGPFQMDDRLRATVVLRPPDKRRRDIMDNLPSSCKAALDGVFKALGVDDSQVDEVTWKRGPVEKQGRVELTLERIG